MADWNRMDECELISLVTAAACGITKCCSEDEISVMSAVFSQLGDTLATVLTYREVKETNVKERVENRANVLNDTTNDTNQGNKDNQTKDNNETDIDNIKNINESDKNNNLNNNIEFDKDNSNSHINNCSK